MILLPYLLNLNQQTKTQQPMKRFVYLWSYLLLALVIGSYAVTMCMFFSAWFSLLAVLSFLIAIKLIYKIGMQLKVLTQYQKSYLSTSVYRQGIISLLVSLWCVHYIMAHSYEQCIYSNTFGIAMFCFFVLCFALRNQLNSFDSV